MRNLLKMYKLISGLPGIKFLIGLTVVISFLEAMTTLIRPYLFKLIVDRVVSVTSHDGAGVGKIWQYLLLLVILSAVLGIVGYFSSIVSNRMFFIMQTSLRTQTYQRLQSLSLDYFETHRVGELSQKLSQGINDFTRLFYGAASDLLSQFITVVLAVALIWRLSPLAGLISLAAIPISLGFNMYSQRFRKENRRQSNIHLEKASGHVYESVSNAATVRSFTNEATSLEYYKGLMDKWFGLSMERTVFTGRMSMVREFLTNLVIVGGMGVIALQAGQGKYTPGDVFLVALYLQQIAGSIRPFGSYIVQTSEAETSAERVIEVMKAEPSVADAPDAVDVFNFESLEFRRVSFRYPGKPARVLKDVSFKIKKGETVALVGPSGVGKTTITKLIMRFYDPTAGKILLNGRNLREYKQESARRLMAAVMQDVALFNDTIEANLQFAAPKAKRLELVEAAKRAHADDFIEGLPDKYKTLVGERGIKLSGGQKQRVAITRAILRNPQLIILDEATSALDSESERMVQEGMQELMQNRSAVVIAHRLSTVMRADTILVLRSGRVVEKGTHKELVKEGGLYAKLFRLQTSHPLEVA